MNRPIHLWLAFAACAAVLLGAVTWITATAVKLQRAQADAARHAQLEEKVRLALWRMDSVLAPLIVQESTWPGSGADFAATGNTLNLQRSTNVLLHFQLGPDGELTSPDVPPVADATGGKQPSAATFATNRARLAQLSSMLDREALLTACPPVTAWGNGSIAQASGDWTVRPSSPAASSAPSAMQQA